MPARLDRDLHQGLLADRPQPNDRGLSRKHIIESLHASLRAPADRPRRPLQAHRFDYETPLEETLRAFDDLVRQGKVHYIGVSEWTAEQIAEALWPSPTTWASTGSSPTSPSTRCSGG